MSPLLHWTYQSKSGGVTMRSGHFSRAENSDSPVWMPYFLAAWLLASTTPWRFSSLPPTAEGTVRRSRISPFCSSRRADQDRKAELTSTWNHTFFTAMAAPSLRRQTVYQRCRIFTPARASL